MLASFPLLAWYPLLAIGGACGGGASPKAPRTDVLRIVGMTCEKCETHVRKELEGLPGIDVVTVSAPDGTATVRCSEEAVPEDAYRRAVFEAGYVLKEVESGADP